MRKSLKIFGVSALVIVVVIVGAVYYLSSNVDSIVENLIEEQGSAATGTAVRVDGVSIDLRAATGSVTGLTVANPEGFSGSPAIEFGTLQLRLDAGSLFETPIVVENIDVGEAKLRMEQSGSRNNLQVLLDKLRGESAAEPEAEDEGKRVVIERFELTDANASLSIADLDEQRTLDVPDIVLTDIGGKSGGATATEVARQVLEPVIRRTLESSAGEAVKERVRDEITERAGDLLDRLGGEGEGDGKQDKDTDAQ
jgi:uncharacterized protein involved in outer membrane biogenesis